MTNNMIDILISTGIIASIMTFLVTASVIFSKVTETGGKKENKVPGTKSVFYFTDEEFSDYVHVVKPTQRGERW